MTKVTKLPRNVDLSNTRLHDSVWYGVQFQEEFAFQKLTSLS